jgi:5'-3' exonuclease
MVLVDFSHLSSRNLFTAISSARPQKVAGKYITSDFTQFHKHQMLNSLRLIQKKYSKEYGEVVLCLDVRGKNWRKEMYQPYKAARAKGKEESEINFEEWYEYLNGFIEDLKNVFPYKVIGVSRAEADDVIGVLAINNSQIGKTLIVSEDKDFKQLLEYPNVDLYAPVKRQFVKMSQKELAEWRLDHILLGDAIDGVPNIKGGTEFSPAFLNHLKLNDIHITKVDEFLELTISEKILGEYKTEKIGKSGKLKGLPTGELDIYKTVSFGEKGARKFAEDLDNNLNSHPMYRPNYERNKELVLFEFIPDELREEITKTYAEISVDFNRNTILNYLSENNFKELIKNYEDFFPMDMSQVEETSSLSDWLD